MSVMLHKAKRLDNHNWVEGYYIHLEWGDRHFILNEKIEEKKNVVGLTTQWNEVDPATVSLCTGYKHDNYNIAENDIFCVGPFESLWIVLWNSKNLCFEAASLENSARISLRHFSIKEIFVVGNKFDTPKLLEGCKWAEKD